jgi:hypothetical protein
MTGLAGETGNDQEFRIKHKNGDVISLIRSGYPDLAKLQETLDDISAQGQRSVDIINRLRPFIRKQEPKNDHRISWW